MCMWRLKELFVSCKSAAKTLSLPRAEGAVLLSGLV